MSKNNKIYRAGLIPFIKNGNDIKIMLMKPSNPKYGGDRFQIAKGKIDPGETTKEAAIREAEEELGLFQVNVIRIEKLGNFLGRMTIYVAEMKDKDLFGMPHFETGETAWMTVSEFQEFGRTLHRPLILAAERLIGEMLSDDGE